MTKEKTQGDELSAMLRNRAAHSSEHARNSSITLYCPGDAASRARAMVDRQRTPISRSGRVNSPTCATCMPYSERRSQFLMLPACGGALSTVAVRRPSPNVNRQRGVDCNLPTKAAAEISECAGVLGAENNLVFGLDRNNKILAVTPHRNLSPVLHAPSPFAQLFYAATASKSSSNHIIHSCISRVYRGCRSERRFRRQF